MQLDPRDQREVERLFSPVTFALGARLVLFGSRARGDASPTSDIDLALVAPAPIAPEMFSDLREQLDESRLPVTVDLVDYARADPALRAVIDREGVPWPI